MKRHKKQLIIPIICSYLVLILIFTILNSIVSSEDSAQLNDNGGNSTAAGVDTRQSFTHSVLAEDLTGTWCQYCPSASENLQSIYDSGDYQFYFVTLIEDVNEDANARCTDDYNLPGYPTVIFDGGYEEEVGGQSNDSQYRAAIESCGARTVPDIDLYLIAETLGDAELEISVQIINNEGSDYSGHLRVYITEIESRYDDYDGNPYPFAFLDYAFDESLMISAGDYYENSMIWDGAQNLDSLGDDFGDIDPSNIMVIGAVFNSDRNIKKYSQSLNVYSAYYVDETAGVIPGEGGGPDTTPPTVQITNPVDNDIVSGTVTIYAIVIDSGNISNVQYRIDNGMWEVMFHEMTDPGSPATNYFADWNTNSPDFPNDVYTITVRATDAMYNSGTDSITVTVNNEFSDFTKPAIVFVHPIDGALVRDTVTMTVKVTDDSGVNNVEYRIDSGDWHPMTRSSGNEYEAQWDTSGVSTGTHTISVKAVDTANNEDREDITVTVDVGVDDGDGLPGFESTITIIAIVIIILMIKITTGNRP